MAVIAVDKRGRFLIQILPAEINRKGHGKGNLIAVAARDIEDMETS